jgi:hypothetical protein
MRSPETSGTVLTAEAVTVLLTIGDLARVGRVSTRTLRHFDEAGCSAQSGSDPGNG